jgi:hypothetical protein
VNAAENGNPPAGQRVGTSTVFAARATRGPDVPIVSVRSPSEVSVTDGSDGSGGNGITSSSP